MKGYDPLKRAEKLRKTMIKPEEKKILLANLSNTAQTQDLTAARVFGDGIFRSKIYTKPIDRELDPFRGEPAGIAAKQLTIPEKTIVCPQECNAAFLGQINGCNLKCWYCYVDKISNSANPRFGTYVSAEEYLLRFLVASRIEQNSINPDTKLNVLRISGGEVFIIPEIIVWIIEAIEKYNLRDYIYIWVDCNLCTGRSYWEKLSPEERKKIRTYKNIGFCGCYKGFDEETFYENTGGANPIFFEEQIKMHKALVDEGLDIYTYLYPVVRSKYGLRKRLTEFMERLQNEIYPLAPLKMMTPPIKVYGPTKERLTPERKEALENQWLAIKIWKEELRKRFSAQELSLRPNEINNPERKEN